MPKPTFFRLPAPRRELVVEAAVEEFAERSFADASLSAIARRTGVAKGSFYQYFDDKLDLYRWLLTDEVPRKKAEFVGAVTFDGDFWRGLEDFIERGMAFLVEHPRLARLAAAAADPTASAEVRGLHLALCEAGISELKTLLAKGAKLGEVSNEVPLDVTVRFVSTVIRTGPHGRGAG